VAKSKPKLESDLPPVREKALELLARREHSFVDLENKLRLRGYSQEEIRPGLEQLRSEGLLSEARFAEMYLRSRVSKGYGPTYIRAALREHAIAEETISDALSCAEVDWQQLANSVRVKKFGESLPVTYKDRARQAGFLGRRGFGTDIVKQIMRDE